MEENNLITVDTNGEIVNTGMTLLGDLPTMSLEDAQRDVFSSTPNRLTLSAQRKGVTDTLMHIGQQLKSEDVANHVLTIIRVAYATIPAVDMNNNPIYGEDGKQKNAVYPVCHFAEAPGYWYNGGTMLKKIIEAWAEEVGDDQSDPNLPTVNAEIASLGGVRAYFDWKKKRDHSGQRYMNMILC